VKLSPNFTLAEATKSQTAARLGIDNTPPATVMPALRAVATNILEPVRAHYGVPIVPSSWYRCPALNKAIGSGDKSQHVLGEAVDFEVGGISNLDVASFIVSSLNWDQVLLEYYIENQPFSGWVHVSLRASENRREVLRFDGKSYKVGLVA
jgi:hypothetical protein